MDFRKLMQNLLINVVENPNFIIVMSAIIIFMPITEKINFYFCVTALVIFYSVVAVKFFFENL